MASHCANGLLADASAAAALGCRRGARPARTHHAANRGLTSHGRQVAQTKQTSPRRRGRVGDVVLVAAAAAEGSVQTPPATMSAADLKAALLDSLFGVDRGLQARGEVRAEINELITQLEAKNPTPSPTEALELLSGTWRLVYTSNSEVVAMLGLGRLPLVSVGDITQEIDGPAMTVANKITITVPFSRTSFSTKASFEVRSPKRLQVKFEKGIISTPELLEDIDLPSDVTIMGQKIDLTQANEALKPFNATVRDAVAQLGTFISQQPDIQIPIQNERAQFWLLTTYLDEDTRISRGDGGSVYVLVKDVRLTETEASTETAVPEVVMD